jgi:hypothetical protein
VEFHLTGADHDTALVGVARRTWFDWIYKWDTTAVRNGTYTLSSSAFNFVGDVGRSTGITITVQN